MLIAFRDFVPQLQQKRLLGMRTEYESFHEVVSRVNQWIEQAQIAVLNVETVLVPKLDKDDTETPPVQIEAPGLATVYPIVRVWYWQRDLAEPPVTGPTVRLDSA